MLAIQSHRPERRLRVRTLRLVVSTAAFLAVVAGTLFIGHPVIDAMANGIARAQLVPSLLRWRDLASVGAGAALFVAPLLLGATLLFGRGYCSSLCPLGTAQDLLMLFVRRRLRLRFRPPHPWLRATSVTAVLGLWLAGSSLLLALVEPYAIFHRGLVALGSFFSRAPDLMSVSKSPPDPGFAPHPAPGSIGLSPDAAVSLPAGQAVATMIGLITAILSLLLLLAVLVAAAVDGRIFCTTLCPAGSLLSAPARRSLLRIRLSMSLCTSCGICEQVCPTRCIDSRHRRVYAGSCILCFECLEACPSGALRYGLRRGDELPSGSTYSARVRMLSGRRSVRP